MNNLLPFKFRFDASLEYDIPENLIDFYVDLCSDLFKIEANIPGDIVHKAISVEEGEVDINPNIISDLFSLKINNEYKEFATPDEDIYLIDLLQSKGTKILYPLINEQIIPFFQKNNIEKKQFIQPIFFILLESLYTGEKTVEIEDPETGEIITEHFYAPESYYILLEKYIKNGSVCILGYNNNQATYSWKDKSFQKITNFSEKTEKLKKNTLDLMKYKLIKKVGHFERRFKGNHNACQQFFYTGEYCKDEIFELLNENIIDSYKKKEFNPKYLIFHCPLSPWLKESIIRCKNELLRLKSKNKYKDLNIEVCYDIDDFEKEINIKKIKEDDCDVLFIVDFIHSGTAFKSEFAGKVRPYFPKARVKGITFLCTKSATKKFKHNEESKLIEIYIPEDSIKVPVKYFLNVDHTVYDKDDKIETCPMCKYELLQRVDSTYEGNLKLSSYEMWLISNSAKYIEEHVKPTINREVHYLPDTMRIIEEFGPYLAYKFYQNLIKIFPNNEDRPRVIVFPDETSNIYYKKKKEKDNIRIEDTPSGFYAKCLKELLKFEIFGVPREIIHALKGEGEKGEGNDIKQIKLEDIPKEFPEIHEKLERLPTNFIIVDEFYLSGDSLNMMLAILKQSGKSPKCYFPILNYGLEKMTQKISNGDYNDFRVLTLYEFNIN